MNADKFVRSLYTSVDNKDIDGLASKLAESVRFKFSNYDAVIGIEDVLQANTDFFSSVKSMRHTLDGTWQQGDTLICNGQVHYVRLDDTEFSVEFATILNVINEKISNYLIYADVSGL